MEKCDIIIQENKKYLELFDEYLETLALSDKTIRLYQSYIDMYINDYLAERRGLPMKNGCNEVHTYFTRFFIPKVATGCDNVNKHCAALNKFYQCMLLYKHITKEEYSSFRSDMKEFKTIWLELVESDY